MENKIALFKSKYCTENECLPLVKNIKNLLENPDNYKPLSIKISVQEGDQMSVVTTFQSSEGPQEGLGWVDLNGQVIHFALN